MRTSELVRYLERRGIILMIVPTVEIVGDAFDDLKVLDYFDPNLDRIFDRLLGIIATEAQAISLLELERVNYEFTFKEIDKTKCEMIGRCIYDVGLRLFYVLKSLGAYDHGYLVYLKKGWVGSNLLMTRIHPKEIPDIN